MNLFRYLLMASLVFQLLQASAQQATQGKAPEKSLWLEVDNLNFFRNNEYFTDLAKGYTLLGFHLTPTLKYRVKNKLILRGGLHVLKFSGRERFKKVDPYFSVKYYFTPRFSIALGSHTLSERLPMANPLFGEEQFIEDYIGNGLNFKYTGTKFSGNLWLDWEDFIYRGDPFRERFTTGGAIKYSIFPQTWRWRLRLPVQMVIRHKGGQINNSNLPTTSVINYGSGLNLHREIKKAFIKEVGVQIMYFGYNELANKRVNLYEEGFALYPQLNVRSKHGHFEAGYWYADKFYAPLGHPMYQNISLTDNTRGNKFSELITAGLAYHKKVLKGVEIKAGFDNYFEISSGRWNYTYSLSLSFKEAFFLKAIK